MKKLIVLLSIVFLGVMSSNAFLDRFKYCSAAQVKALEKNRDKANKLVNVACLSTKDCKKQDNYKKILKLYNLLIKQCEKENWSGETFFDFTTGKEYYRDPETNEKVYLVNLKKRKGK